MEWPSLSNRTIRFGAIALFVLFIILLIGIALILLVQEPIKAHEKAQRILTRAPLIDGHNAFPSNIRIVHDNDLRKLNFSTNLTRVYPMMMTDLPRMRAGKLGGQIWSASSPCDAQHKDAVVIALEQIDLIKRMITNYSHSLELVTTSEEIGEMVLRGKIASIIAIDGGHSIQYSLGVLRSYYELGARVMALVEEHCSVPWAQSYIHIIPEQQSKTGSHPLLHGLTPFGKQVIWEMNRLGMIIDVANCALASMRDAITSSHSPVIISRAAAKAICNQAPNIPDDILSDIKHRDGLVMITFSSLHIACSQTNATISDVIRHLEHMRDKMSIDNVGIGSNFDNLKGSVIQGLEDPSKFPNLFAALIETGRWSDEDLEKLAGKNFLRVMKKVEQKRDESLDRDPAQMLISRADLRLFTNNNCSGTLLPMP